MWYIVLSRSKPEMEEEKRAHYEEHRIWLEEQHRSGRLLFSGPTTDGRYGVYVMLASNLEEAQRVAAEDPHHKRGIRSMEVLEWNPHRAFRMDRHTIADVENLARAR
ncbi:MAG TPA: YciI family protein [Candidatus Eisenbacteria bacterium]|nr:YciI family protein [Candidatus Eisenbacteria bacterium]